MIQMSQEGCKILRNWAKAHGAVFRQRKVRQETNMGKLGTLPEYMYHRWNKVAECVDVFSDNHPDTIEDIDVSEGRVDEASDEENNLGEADEFDVSSDEEGDDEGFELANLDLFKSQCRPAVHQVHREIRVSERAQRANERSGSH